MSKKLKFLVTLLILVFILGTSTAFAQDDGTISGTDPDSTTSNSGDSTTSNDDDSTVKNKVLDVRDTFKSVVEDRANRVRTDVNRLRENLREKDINRDEATDRFREDTQERREDFRDAVGERRDNLRDNIEDRGTTVEERRAQLEEKKTQRRTELEERRTERVEKLKARARAHVERISKRFYAAIERIEKFIDRVRSRMEKLEERGIDTSEANGYLDEAVTFLQNAKDTLSRLPGALEVALASDNPKEAFRSSVREIFQEAKRQIKEAHAFLVKAIASLKASANHTKLQECPDRWVIDLMQESLDEDGNPYNEPREYYSLNGERRELREFDLNWVEENCDLEPQEVF